MKPLSQELLDYIHQDYPSYEELTLTLARIPAPSHHEEKRAAFVKEKLESYGCKGVVIDEALNVVYPYHCEGASRIHVICGHTDVVFEDTTELPLRREGSIVYCPGIGDDTANATLVMTLAKYLARFQPETEDGILLVCNSCEEGLGNLDGTRKIMETYGDRVVSFISFDGTFGGVIRDAVGSTRYRVTVREEGGHSFGAFGKPNAIIELAQIITKLAKVQVPKKEGTKTTFNVGTITGGTSVNTIAPDASMLCEYRSDDRGGLEIMRRQFEAIFEEAKGQFGQVDVEVVGQRPCSNIAPEKQQAILDQMKEIHLLYSEEPPKFRTGSTDCNIPLSLGIPATVIGTHVQKGAHTRGEWLDLAYAERAMKIAFSVLSLYLK